jgi:hypothetical protein
MRRRKAKQLRARGEASYAASEAAYGPAQARARAQGVVRKGQRRRRKPRGPARQTRWMRVLGLLIATGGGVAIGFGWAGAAQESCVDCQIPFLLSGGAAGIGLIIFGVALMLLAQIRTESRRLGDRIEHALGLRARPEEPRPPSTGTERVTRPQASAASPIAQPRGEDAAVTAAAGESRPMEAALASSEPSPHSAEPADVPAAQSDATNSDAATFAATTMAGGVVDSQVEGGDAGQSPEALGDPERRHGLFRRRKGS